MMNKGNDVYLNQLLKSYCRCSAKGGKRSLILTLLSMLQGSNTMEQKRLDKCIVMGIPLFQIFSLTHLQYWWLHQQRVGASYNSVVQPHLNTQDSCLISIWVLSSDLQGEQRVLMFRNKYFLLERWAVSEAVLLLFQVFCFCLEFILLISSYLY